MNDESGFGRVVVFCLAMGDAFLAHPAASQQRFARDPARVIGCEESNSIRNIIRLTNAAERSRSSM